MAVQSEDTLRDYRAKRDFTRTAEPSGATKAKRKAKPAPLRFVVQKHDATRLHFDFRLELDGVLKSWAVTRGPSTNPADKRLAVRVEDHPLDYGSFEGTIPEGEYGGVTVMLWDEGTWEPVGDPHEGIESGDLKFRLSGKRMQGEWVLVHMKGRDSKTKSGSRENWLLIKHRDEHATDTGDGLVEKFTTSVETGRDLTGIAKGLKPKKAAAKSKPKAKVWTGGKALVLPDFREPQLATLVDAVPTGKGWLFETKYDGYRALAAIAGAEVRVFTRNGHDWTEQFHRLVAPLAGLTKGTALLDGEICALKDGRTDFSTLKDALSTGGDLTYFVFDLLEQDGDNLEALPLVERKARLQKLLGKPGKNPVIHYSEHVHDHGEKVYAAMAAAGHEGVIAKKADAPYRHDRTRTWLKIKSIKRQEFVIGGWRPSEKKKSFASLLLGTWENGKLIYRGRVGTGFTVDSATELQGRLDQNPQQTSPFETVPRDVSRAAKWVAPNLVAEIAYAELTPDGHLRHPSFLGLREDKPGRDIHIETAAPSPKEVKSSSRIKAMKLTDDMGIAAAERLGVRLTHPERVVFEEQDITKAEMVAYYEAVSERMLPFIANRPLSLVRCPQGPTGHCFFQKHDTGSFPSEIKRIPITEKDGSKEEYFYVDDLAGIVAAVQMNTLEFHLWGSLTKDIEKPERLVFDIDPDEGLDFKAVRSAALHIRDVLGEWGFESFPMVSGGKGIHVIVPIKPLEHWPEIKLFCKTFAERLARNEPDRFTANLSKAARKGRLFIDYLRNERGSTAISPFSIRSRKGAPVAVPVAWDEVETLKAANLFSLEEAAARANAPDPWPNYFKLTQTVTKGMLEAVAGPLRKS